MQGSCMIRERTNFERERSGGAFVALILSCSLVLPINEKAMKVLRRSVEEGSLPASPSSYSLLRDSLIRTWDIFKDSQAELEQVDRSMIVAG
eukprot:273539-Rhodomonas_salina.3